MGTFFRSYCLWFPIFRLAELSPGSLEAWKCKSFAEGLSSEFNGTSLDNDDKVVSGFRCRMSFYCCWVSFVSRNGLLTFFYSVFFFGIITKQKLRVNSAIPEDGEIKGSFLCSASSGRCAGLLGDNALEFIRCITFPVRTGAQEGARSR